MAIAVICEAKKSQDWTHEGKAIARMMGRILVKGRTILLRKWSPKENMVVHGKFRRGWLVLKGFPFHLWDEVQLNFILKKWGRVTKVAKETLKLVDLTKAKLWVEMLPNVVLPALLEVEDGKEASSPGTLSALKEKFGGQRGEWKGKEQPGPVEENFIGPSVPEISFKAHTERAQSGMRIRGLQAGPRSSSSPLDCSGFVSFSPASCFPCKGDRDALSRR
ncbi:hypothetical protein CK203_110895 [Vitis vinifera]|uniref:Uncharacterized protein n=1 Tax=Vitis vinifera TaxID=29760 RepID=A0A438CPA3_VITVI|nr:hypothetical protein CK203_110895 [Vitis vinifera]